MQSCSEMVGLIFHGKIQLLRVENEHGQWLEHLFYLNKYLDDIGAELPVRNSKYDPENPPDMSRARGGGKDKNSSGKNLKGDKKKTGKKESTKSKKKK